MQDHPNYKYRPRRRKNGKRAPRGSGSGNNSSNNHANHNNNNNNSGVHIQYTGMGQRKEALSAGRSLSGLDGNPSPSASSSSPALYMSGASDINPHTDNGAEHGSTGRRGDDFLPSFHHPPFFTSSGDHWDSPSPFKDSTQQTPTLYSFVPVHEAQGGATWSHVQSSPNTRIPPGEMWRYENHYRHPSDGGEENGLVTNSSRVSYPNSSPGYLEASLQQKGWISVHPNSPSPIQVQGTTCTLDTSVNYYYNAPSYTDIRQGEVVMTGSFETPPAEKAGVYYENFDIVHQGDIVALESPLHRNAYNNAEMANRKPMSLESSQSSGSLAPPSDSSCEDYTLTTLDGSEKRKEVPGQAWKSDRDRPSVLVSNTSI